MKNFWSKFNELVFSPIAILAFAGAYYGVYRFFGPEAGLIPPGYFTNVLAGAAVMYIAGFMATFAIRLNFYHFYLAIYDPHKLGESLKDKVSITAICVYFSYYALAIWALTSML